MERGFLKEMEIRVKEQPKELENRVKWPHGKKKIKRGNREIGNWKE